MQEIPGGLVDDGESIEGAARRELHEETGYTAEKMIYLGEVFKDAYSNATWHFFSPRAAQRTLVSTPMPASTSG